MTDDAAQNSEKQTTESRDANARTLGLARWVQVAFMVFFLGTLWLLDKIVTLIWKNFDEPNPTAVTAMSAAIAGVATFILYRHEKVKSATHEVIGELSKVTWPSRKETYTSSIVVVITSVIAAAILGGFDAVWSTITDLIYKV